MISLFLTLALSSPPFTPETLSQVFESETLYADDSEVCARVRKKLKRKIWWDGWTSAMGAVGMSKVLSAQSKTKVDGITYKSTVTIIVPSIGTSYQAPSAGYIDFLTYDTFREAQCYVPYNEAWERAIQSRRYFVRIMNENKIR